MPYVIRTNGVDDDDGPEFVGIGPLALHHLQNVDIDEEFEGMEEDNVSVVAEALFQCLIDTGETPRQSATIQMEYGTHHHDLLFRSMAITYARINTIYDDAVIECASVPSSLHAAAIAISIAMQVLDYNTRSTAPLTLPSSATLRAGALRSRLLDGARHERIAGFLKAVGLRQDAEAFEKEFARYRSSLRPSQGSI